MTKRLMKDLLAAAVASAALCGTVIGAHAYDLERHTQAEIKDMYNKMYFDLHDVSQYSEGYSAEYPTYAGKLEQDTLDDGLDSVNFCRYLAGLPYDVELDSTYNELAQNASLIIYINKVLSHTPSKPAVMSDAVYELAYKGSGESNIGKGYMNIQASVTEGYMADTDENNISKLGHRRWLLNPDMQKTGLGAVYDSTAMYVRDKSRKEKFTGDYICWPPANMPYELLGENKNGYAYSVTLNTKTYSKPERDKVKVTLTSKLLGKTFTFDKNSPSDVSKLVGYFNVSDANITSNNNCIIFNPGILPRNDVIDVRVTGIYDKDGNEKPVSYKVNYFDLLDADDYTLGFPEDKYEVELGTSMLLKGYDHPLSSGGYRIWNYCETGGRIRDYFDMIQSGGNIYFTAKKEGVVYLYEGTADDSFDDIYTKVTVTHKHTRGSWIVEKAPTEMEAGSRFRVCSECGRQVDREVMPATSVAAADIELAEDRYVYSGEAIEPKIKVHSGGKRLTEGTDYTVSYKDNVYVGTAKLTIKGKGYFSGTKTVDFAIERREPVQLSKLSITVKSDGLIYTGRAIVPKVTIKEGAYTLVNDKDYTLQLEDNINAGTGKLTIKGEGDYLGTRSYSFKIEPADIGYPWSVDRIEDVRYTGRPIMIRLELRSPVSGEALVEGEDYTVSYVNNVGIGKATITVTGMKNHSGTAEMDFNIVSPEDYKGPEQRDDVIDVDCNTGILIKGGSNDTEVIFVDKDGGVTRMYANADGTLYTNLPEGEYTVWITRSSYMSVRTEISAGDDYVSVKADIFRYGDINKDGLVNVTDTSMSAAFTKGKRVPKNDEQRMLSDVNRDGKLNVTDTSKIAAHSKGKKQLSVTDIPPIPGIS